MEALDSPVESLALNYLSYDFLTAVNKMLAAWVAAVTAAFGFWRFGTSSSPPRPEQRCRITDAAPPSCAPPVLSELAVADEPPALLVSDGIKCISPNFGAESISPKGKFVLYCRNDDDFREGEVEDDVGAATAALEDNKFRRWMDMDLERKIDIRMANMGWYRCQDLAVLNGSVVRLWDDCFRVRAAA